MVVNFNSSSSSSWPDQIRLVMFVFRQIPNVFCLLSFSLSDVKICIVIQWIMISDFYPKWPAKKTNIFNQYLFIILTWNFWSPKIKIFLLQFANKFFLATLNIFKIVKIFKSEYLLCKKIIKMLEAFIDSLSLYFNERKT